MHIEWPGLTDENTLIISIDTSEFDLRPEGIEIAGKLFKPKQETHITVLGSTAGSTLSHKITGEPANEEMVRNAFESTDWSYRRTTDLRHLVRTGAEADADTSEESIIVLLEMNGMAQFHQQLKLLNFIDSDLPLPPAHVTLYTFNCDGGIGVHSERQLEELTREQMVCLPARNAHVND